MLCDNDSDDNPCDPNKCDKVLDKMMHNNFGYPEHVLLFLYWKILHTIFSLCLLRCFDRRNVDEPRGLSKRVNVSFNTRTHTHIRPHIQSLQILSEAKKWLNVFLSF